MSIALPKIGPGEFIAQLAENDQEDTWFILILPALVPSSQVAARLAEEVRDVLGLPVDFIQGTHGPADLAARLGRVGRAKVTIIFDVDAYREAEWRHLDLLRTRLEGGGIKVLLLSLSAVEMMENFASHLSSFVGGAAWQLDLDSDYLSVEEIEERLCALRSAFGRKDDEVIAMAKRKELPPEPEFAKWLLLLGRGDLL